MDIWRIFKHEQNKYTPEYYATRDLAVKALIWEVTGHFRKHRLRQREAFDSISKEEMYRTGVYYHTLYGLRWTVELTNVPMDSEKECIVDDKDGWQIIDSETVLEDGTIYEIETYDGDIISGFYNGESDTFDVDGEDYYIEEAFKIRKI